MTTADSSLIPSLGVALSRADYARLGRQITAESAPGLRWLKVALLGSFTTDFLRPYLIVEGARRGLGFDLWEGPFGQIEQQALDDQSDLYRQKADVVLILPRLEDLEPELVSRFASLSPANLEAARESLVGRLATILSSLRARGTWKILIGNFPPPLWQAAGAADVGCRPSQTSFVQSLNDALAAQCREWPDAIVLDVARIASEVGLSKWRDDRLAYLAKAPWSAEAMSATATAAARRMRPWFIPPKKCLVLDLDNTLWGGVLGEAGLEGIALGPDHPGNVFVEFQRRVLALRDCGILLAAASKNNLRDVEAALTQHPSCLLKLEHFAALEIHWEEKAGSLRRIASKLQIGLDSLVFFDDHPVERAWVREQCPEVTVIEVPESPMGYVQALSETGVFDTLALTAEDRRRAEIYQEESARSALEFQAGSRDAFLKGLKMKLTVGLVDESTLPRVTQLLAKTNQFNLTMRRHSAAAVEGMVDQGGFALWTRLSDRFGDSGLVGVVIAVPQTAGLWSLDSFLMSCRVIGRGVETAMLALAEQLIRARGGNAMAAEFLETSKNAPAADFLPRHGFQSSGGEGSFWQRPLAPPTELPSHFEIELTYLPTP